MEDINKSNHVEVDSVNIRTCHRNKDTRLNQPPLVSMAGTPKNKLSKIRMEMIKRDNKVAQDDVESTASLDTALTMIPSDSHLVC